MRPLTAEDEATLRAIAARHGYRATRGPHAGDGSASRLIDALLAGEVVTLALAPAERRRLVSWLEGRPAPEGPLAAVLRSLAAQVCATLPVDPVAGDARPDDGPDRASALPPGLGQGATTQAEPAPAPESDGRRSIDVELWLRVENNSKFVRGKTKARAWIEDSMLRPHAMRKLHADRSDYILTLAYGRDEDLDATIDDILREADRIADLHHCFIEADVRALDGSDRSW